MDALFVSLAVFGVLLAIGIALAVFFVRREIRKSKEGDTGLLLLQNQLQELRNTLDTKLGTSAQMFQQQFSETTKIVRDVTEKLTRLDETNKQVMGFADQLRKLEDILKNPKQRGILGEYYLETLLKNVFAPTQYQMQYKFADGEIVDAVIFVKDKIIPIDSKFSLENYNRVREETDPVERERLEKIFKQDLKNRIDETAKYVRPQEGTMDFAFMFIPAEGIYYDLLVNQIGAVKTSTRDLIEYAFIEKRVHIVSPTTFLSHLKMILQGLRAMKIEESAKDIQKDVGNLMRHLASYEQYLQGVGRALDTTVNQYNRAYKEFNKIDKDVLRITGSSNEVEVLELDQPDREE